MGGDPGIVNGGPAFKKWMWIYDFPRLFPLAIDTGTVRCRPGFARCQQPCRMSGFTYEGVNVSSRDGRLPTCNACDGSVLGRDKGSQEPTRVHGTVP